MSLINISNYTCKKKQKNILMDLLIIQLLLSNQIFLSYQFLLELSHILMAGVSRCVEWWHRWWMTGEESVTLPGLFKLSFVILGRKTVILSLNQIRPNTTKQKHKFQYITIHRYIFNLYRLCMCVYTSVTIEFRFIYKNSTLCLVHWNEVLLYVFIYWENSMKVYSYLETI